MVNIFLTLLVLISVFGAIEKITDDYFQLSSNGIYFFNLVIALIVFFTIFLKKQKISKKIQNSSKKAKIFCLAIVVILVVSWQLWVVISLNGQPLNDANTILNKAMGIQGNDDYFSFYPNNFLILILEKNLWLLFNRPIAANFILILSVLNIFLIDLSIVLAGFAIKKIWGVKVGKVYSVLSTILMGLSPWLTVPYTDIWAYFLSSCALYLTVNIRYSEENWKQIISSLGLGLVIAVSYFMKPSLIIFYIAAVLICLVTFFTTKQFYGFKNVAVVLFSCFLFVSLFSIQKNETNIVNFNKEQAFSMAHFAAMGAIKNGGYNPDDFAADKEIPGADQRKKRDIIVLKKRLKSYKTFANYQRFLMKKQILNTADGSFAWGYDGGTKQPFNLKKHNIPQKMFFENGVATNKSIFSFPIQIVWSLSLILILFTIPDKRLSVQLMKYTVVGFFAFLLLFEGGRSRYIIQFLPFVLLLASVGLGKANEFLERK